MIYYFVNPLIIDYKFMHIYALIVKIPQMLSVIKLTGDL